MNIVITSKNSKKVKFSFAEGDFLKGPILSLNEVTLRRPPVLMFLHITIQQVSFCYPGADKPVLSKVNLSIEMDTKVEILIKQPQF